MSFILLGSKRSLLREFDSLNPSENSYYLLSVR